MPAALAAGLPPMGIAIAVTLSGQGMALASDALMQVAPAISANAADIPDQAALMMLATSLIQHGAICAALGVLFVGMLCGIDGSG